MDSAKVNYISNIINQKKIFFLIPFLAVFTLSLLYIQAKYNLPTVSVEILIPKEINNLVTEFWQGEKLKELAAKNANDIVLTKEKEIEKVSVQFKGKSADEAIKLANQIAEQYVNAINKEATRLFKNTSQKKLKIIKKDLKNIQEKIIKANVELGMAEQNLAVLDKKIEDSRFQLSSLAGEIASLKQRQSGLLRIYTNLHPEVVALDEEIKNLERNLSAIRQPDSKKRAELATDAEKTSKNYESLKRRADILKEEELFLEDGLKKFARVLKYANPLEKPVKDSKKIAFLYIWSFIIALILGTASLYISSVLDKPVYTKTQMQKILDVPILGYMPYIKPSFLVGKKSNIKSNLLLAYKDDFRPYESFKSLYTHMEEELFKTAKKGIILLVTSANRCEGKTFIACNLGLVAAQSGKDVLLIDGNLRFPSVHKLFGITTEKQEGLSDILKKRIDGNEGVRTITDLLIEGGMQWMSWFTSMGIDRLKFVMSGSPVMNTSDLLASERMNNLLNDFKPRHDYIIIDSSAVNASTDSLILAQKADYIVIVYRTAVTPRRDLLEAREKILKIKKPISGVVFNNTNRSIKIL